MCECQSTSLPTRPPACPPAGRAWGMGYTPWLHTLAEVTATPPPLEGMAPRRVARGAPWSGPLVGAPLGSLHRRSDQPWSEGEGGGQGRPKARPARGAVAPCMVPPYPSPISTPRCTGRPTKDVTAGCNHPATGHENTHVLRGAPPPPPLWQVRTTLRPPAGHAPLAPPPRLAPPRWTRRMFDSVTWRSTL